MRVIIDTNVFVSGLISESGNPAKIIDAVLRGILVPVMSTETFAELEAVLKRPRLQPYFQGAGMAPSHLLEQLQKLAQFVTPKTSHTPLRDEKDRPFLELAATHPAPDFIVTGDKDFEQDRYEGVPVISTTLFVEAIL